jgi:hypothetical protein
MASAPAPDDVDFAARSGSREDPVVAPESKALSPYNRLVDMLTAPTRCAHCGRTDPLTPDGVAAAVGLSESVIRRLAQPDAGPSMRTVKVMAERLDMPALRLMEVLWPEMAQ